MGIGTLFVKIGQNEEIQCSVIGRQPISLYLPQSVEKPLEKIVHYLALPDHVLMMEKF